MCDCHKSITDQLTERFKNATPDASDHKVELQGYGFTVTENRMELRPFMPYKAGAEYPLKKGGTKWKSKTGNMFFNFCPFCGERHEQATAAAGVPGTSTSEPRVGHPTHEVCNGCGAIQANGEAHSGTCGVEEVDRG